MGSPGSTAIAGITSEQNDTSVTRYSKSYGAFQFQTGDALPLLVLPPDFDGYGFSKSRKTFNNKETIFLPDVDKILNEYTAQRLRILFTIKFVELINQQFFLFDFSPGGNDKLAYAVTFYFKVCNLPLVLNSDDARKTLAFYFGTASGLEIPSMTLKQSHLTQLAGTLPALEMKYFNQLKEVNYVYQKKPLKLGDESARWFISFANTTIEKDLVIYFANIKARLIQNLPDATVNDPRFKASLEDARWDEYDDTIKTEVATYNAKFNNVAGYKPLDWRIVKAMVWTEILAGPKGNKAQWEKYPLQIGRFSADAGASVVRGGRENSDLITSPNLRQQLQNDITGKNNIRAGIAYLFVIAIKGKVGWREQIDNGQVVEYTIQPKDNGLEAIAKKLETTSDNIAGNSGISKTAILKPGQTLRYQKAHVERRIEGWNDWLETVNNYNGGGDANYMDKFNRAYQIITSRSGK